MSNDIIFKMDELIERFVVIGQKPRRATIRMDVKAEDSQNCHYADDEEDAEWGRSTVIINSDGLFLKNRSQVGLLLDLLIWKT